MISILSRRLVWFAAVTLVIVSLQFGVGTTSEEPAVRIIPPPADFMPREFPNDPPGIPARVLPGAMPTAPVQFGSFVSIQANVAPGGVNIPGDAANEPSIAIDPTSPNRMAIGWRQFDTITSDFRQAGWGYSDDGGRTWTFPGVLEPGVFRSDPVLDYDAAGNFYYNSLQVDTVNGVRQFDCQVFKSVDRGMSWGPAVWAFGGDKQWMAIDRTGGIGDGHIYCDWTPLAPIACCGDSSFTRSVDGGASFEPPLVMPEAPVHGTITVGSNGTVYMAGKLTPTTHVFAKSADAQNAAVTPTFEAVPIDLGGPTAGFDGYDTPNPIGLLGQPWIASDHSGGPTAGNIYVLASVDPAGIDPLDVHFIRSEDGGSNWSTPVRVNDDPPHEDGWQWFGTMSVAPNGRIDVIWNDSRNWLTPNLSELYYSFSTDGGVSWSPNQQLSPVWDSHIGWPQQDKIGDYYELISDDVGAHLAWSATFNGEQDIYYMRIGDYDCNTNGIGDSLDIAGGGSDDVNGNGIPDECETMAVEVAVDIKPGSCPNPLNVKLFEEAQNARSRKGGVIPVALVGGVDLDVMDVDVTTLRLQGVAPVRHNHDDVATPVIDGDHCECTEEDGDGITDITLKFSALDVVANLPVAVPGETLVLKLTGELLDGTPIEGRDCVVIVGGQPAVVVLEPPPGPILSAAFPNPFNPATTIRFTLPAESYARLSVYDVGGRLVENLVNGYRDAGEHVVSWDAGQNASGIYFYRLEAGGEVVTRRMVLLK